MPGWLFPVLILIVLLLAWRGMRVAMNAPDTFGGLLALGIWMLERIIQGPPILLLWGMLAIASGVYLGALERIPEGASGWRSLWKSIGLVLFLLGVLEIIGAATGGDDWMKPLKSLRSTGQAVTTEHVEFKRIKSTDDLDAAVALANKNVRTAWAMLTQNTEYQRYPLAA